MNEKDVAHAKQLMADIHQQFIGVVKEGRGKRLKEAPEIFSGLIWTGQKSVELGLADGFGSLDSVAREVVKAEDIVDFTPRENVVESFARRFGASAASALVESALRDSAARNSLAAGTPSAGARAAPPRGAIARCVFAAMDSVGRVRSAATHSRVESRAGLEQRVEQRVVAVGRLDEDLASRRSRRERFSSSLMRSLRFSGSRGR